MTDPSLVVSSGERVEVRNKIGAYFSIKAPHSLNISHIEFNAVDSLSEWKVECLTTHEPVCNLDPITKAVSNIDTSKECNCRAPQEQTP